MIIKSHSGDYSVCESSFQPALQNMLSGKAHVILDEVVYKTYASKLDPILAGSNKVVIFANESAKSFDRIESYIKELMQQSIRRDHILIALGGGVIQDITAFLASILFRGIDWNFFPTTLLAQSDSCIGSKSSINVGCFKNIVGTYSHPQNIIIDSIFLNSLTNSEINSGIGEMLKVHAIAGVDQFSSIRDAFPSLKLDQDLMKRFIFNSLEYKKKIIEQDEFDADIRKVMNYGHSFGHAIEVASEYLIPHGIAVTIGMDLANYVAWKLKITSREHFERMHAALTLNYEPSKNSYIDFDKFMKALTKDKKNKQSQLGLVLLNQNGVPEFIYQDKSPEFIKICANYFSEVFSGG